MLFVVLCEDKPGALDVRMENRPKHVEFLKGLGATLKLAGPFLGVDDKPVGSMLVLEADSAEKAAEIAGGDPYALAGLFESVQVRRWNWTINNPDA